MFFLKYIRVDVETDPVDLFQYLFKPEGWNLPEPSLVLSFIGSTSRYCIPDRIVKALQNGLIKVASQTEAWLITSGTRNGITKIVSEIVGQSKSNLTMLGIALWGCVSKNEALVVNK